LRLRRKMSTLMTSVNARMMKTMNATTRMARKAFEKSRKKAATKARRMAMRMASRIWTIVAKGAFRNQRNVFLEFDA